MALIERPSLSRYKKKETKQRKQHVAHSKLTVPLYVCAASPLCMSHIDANSHNRD